MNSEAPNTCPLRVESITKAYGKKSVLHSLSLSLNPGEIFGLIGVNGAGKTTLIKIVLDLLKPDGGETRLFDKPSSCVSARANLSYLPEKFQPSRYLKGREYLSLSLSFYKKPYDHALALQEAASLDLEPESLGRLVGSYSKGMGQKLGLLGAFMVDTKLMILDEPMSGLDPKARILLKRKMLEAKKAGKTIFFSSHILADIDEICDRIGVIHDGELLFLGTPALFKDKNKHQNLEAAFLEAIGTKEAA